MELKKNLTKFKPYFCRIRSLMFYDLLKSGYPRFCQICAGKWGEGERRAWWVKRGLCQSAFYRCDKMPHCVCRQATQGPSTQVWCYHCGQELFSLREESIYNIKKWKKKLLLQKHNSFIRKKAKNFHIFLSFLGISHQISISLDHTVLGYLILKTV